MDGSSGPSRLPPEGAAPNGRRQPDQIRQAMKELRAEIHRDAEMTREDASQLVDWKSHVQSHPLLSVGVAVAAGFLLAPTAKRAVTLSDEQIASLAKKGRLDVSAEAKTATAASVGMASSLLMTLGAYAGRALLGYGVQRLGAVYQNRHNANQPQPATNPHEPSFY